MKIKQICVGDAAEWCAILPVHAVSSRNVTGFSQ